VAAEAEAEEGMDDEMVPAAFVNGDAAEGTGEE